MDLDETRKPSAKRPRMDVTPVDASPPISTVSGSQSVPDQQSMESALAIPVAIVFRTCASQEGRPLLTRAEAECFLRVSFLAQEIDTLVASSELIFLQQRFCNQYTEDLFLPSSPSSTPSSEDSGGRSIANPMLRPLLSVINFVEGKSAPALQHVYHTLSHLSTELLGCSSSLRQSAEQNWTVADALESNMQVNDSEEGPSLSDEKRKVGWLQEELCQRIEQVVGMSLTEDCAYEKPTSSTRLSQSSSQEDRYRRKLFAENDDLEVDSGGDSQGDEQDQPPRTNGVDGNEGVDQQYALDWKPISEYCSELFDDVPQVDSSEEEAKEGENGDSANSNDNTADNSIHLNESQGEREENGDGNTSEDSSDDNGKGKVVAEDREMEVDLVESRIEEQTPDENSSGPEQQEPNQGSMATPEHTSNRHDEQIAEIDKEKSPEQGQREHADGPMVTSEHRSEYHDEQTPEIDKESQGIIQRVAQTDYRVTSDSDGFPSTQQESFRQDYHENENHSDELHSTSIAPNENEKHPVILQPPVATQPEGSSFPLTAEDDTEEDDDNLDDVRSQRLMCSQRTSSAAEVLTSLGNGVSGFQTKDISLY